MEMGVSFKSSESKANLIKKVTQARQMQNDTCDDNSLVTVIRIGIRYQDCTWFYDER